VPTQVSALASIELVRTPGNGCGLSTLPGRFTQPSLGPYGNASLASTTARVNGLFTSPVRAKYYAQRMAERLDNLVCR
jgi:hypothetical protein